MTPLLLTLLIACPGPEEDTVLAYPPDAWGPWAVGSHEATFTSSSGIATPVQVWYPTAATSTLTHLYDELMEGQALEGTDPDCSAARPVLVFSHGNGGVRYQSLFLTEHLASHGFVVVAPDHVGNTFLDFGGYSTEALMIRRPADLRDSFDWLVSDPSLAGCVDPEAGYAVSGHSFGGYTTLATAGAVLDVGAVADWCAATPEWLCDGVAEWSDAHPGEPVADLSDDRVWAAVPMAPAGYEALLGGLADIAVPTMVLGGTADTLTTLDEQVVPLYAGLTVSPRHLGELTDASHYTFSNACDLAPGWEGCGDPGILPDAIAHPLIAEVTTAFLLEQLGDPDAGSHLPPVDPEWVWTAE